MEVQSSTNGQCSRVKEVGKCSAGKGCCSLDACFLKDIFDAEVTGAKYLLITVFMAVVTGTART